MDAKSYESPEFSSPTYSIVSEDPVSAAQLLPLVYDELRQLANARINSENPGQTLQPTALVHEAYLRLIGNGQAQEWSGRRHFFAAAAEAMRRILVESARRKNRLKRGGGKTRLEQDQLEIPAPELHEDVLALDEALNQLASTEPQAAELVRLHYFAGLTLRQVAHEMAISPRTADRLWAFARAWLHNELRGDEG